MTDGGVTVFQPAVSVGNVGQLAADLIISTLDMARVGHFHSDCLIPMAGNNPYSRGEEEAALLSTNAEGQIRSLTHSAQCITQRHISGVYLMVRDGRSLLLNVKY